MWQQIRLPSYQFFQRHSLILTWSSHGCLIEATIAVGEILDGLSLELLSQVVVCKNLSLYTTLLKDGFALT